MHSNELATQPSEWEALKNRAIASTDMTLIYNVHATPENAKESVNHVQPDSVVFIEGYLIRNETEQGDGDAFDLSYEAYLNALNEIRLQHGKDDPRYQDLKAAILDSIDEIASDYTPQSESDFTLHSLAEIKELLHKDCLVFYADYRESPVEDNAEKMDEYSQHFRMLVQKANVNGFANLSGNSIGNTLRSLIAGVQAEMLKHDERELHAILHSLSAMGQLAALPATTDLRKSNDGRMTAYTIFGTAHARSLTHQFTSHGIQPTVIAIEPLAEHLYLDALTESRYKNYRRRVGHVALSTLAYQLTHDFVAPALIADTYSHLAFLNETSQEERLMFLVSCVRIQQLLDSGDRKAAEKNYFALLRSFMPHSSAFKPPQSQTIHAL